MSVNADHVVKEREAWYFLANMWGNRYDVPDRHPVLNWGICYSVDWMLARGWVSIETAESMSEKIFELAPLPAFLSPWRWPLTLEGSKQRAAFCKQMAELCQSQLDTAAPKTL